VVVYLAVGDTAYTNIKVDLDLSGAAYGLITGTVFTLVNAVFGLLMGYLADRYNRKWLLLVISLLWNTMTILSAFIHNFTNALILRIMFSFFMSACVPLSVSLINDYFVHEQRGRANSLFAFGIYLGGGLSSLSLVLDKQVG
jgi:MFS family permease